MRQHYEMNSYKIIEKEGNRNDMSTNAGLYCKYIFLKMSTESVNELQYIPEVD